MKEFLRKKFNKFWVDNYQYIYEEGACSTCGPDSYEVLEEHHFQNMLNEMDKWIDEEFNDKS